MHPVLKNIRTIREIKGFSQEYIADRLGVTQSSYARFENNAKKIDLMTLEGVAKVFNTTVVGLLEFDSERPFRLPSAHSVLEDDQAPYSRQEMEKSMLEEKVQHLEAQLERANAQIEDKDEIIRLLKSERSGGSGSGD